MWHLFTFRLLQCSYYFCSLHGSLSTRRNQTRSFDGQTSRVGYIVWLVAAFLVNFPIRSYSQILDQHCLIKDRGKPRGFKKRRVMHKLNRSQRFITVHVVGWHWVNMRKSSGRFAGGDRADVVSFLQFFGDKSATRWLFSSSRLVCHIFGSIDDLHFRWIETVKP